MSCSTKWGIITNSVCCTVLKEWIHAQNGHFECTFFLCLQDGYKTTFCFTHCWLHSLPSSSLSCFFSSSTSRLTLASVWSWETKSFHKPHIYKLLVYFVILKDNLLSNQDTEFEFRSSSGKLWSWNHGSAGRSTWRLGSDSHIGKKARKSLIIMFFCLFFFL